MAEPPIPNLERRYPFLDAGGGYFYAGTAAGGRHVLLFTRGVALFFDGDGNLIGSERREPPRPRPYRRRTGKGPDLDSKGNVLAQLIDHWSTPEGRRELEHDMREYEGIGDTFFRPWLAELGFRPGQIWVKKFDDPVSGLSVADLPEHYAEFLADPDAPYFDDEDRSEFPGMIEEWQQNGMFVVRVGDYEWLWMTGEGDVDST
jgi:hypothetical protein